jgi:hypothetical protein
MLLAALAGTAGASTAGAVPAWRFEGTELAKQETIEGDAILSNFVIPGLTNTCKKMHYEMEISNFEETGMGEIDEFSFSTCLTDTEACTIEQIIAKDLPWTVKLAKAGGANYVIVTGIEIGILYGGEECALLETEVPITGSAGALYDNGFETFTFNAASFKATGSTLKAFGTSVQWNGAFTTEATGLHTGEALTVS